MNLDGLRILNTRPAHQNEALSKAIKKAQGVSIELPAIAIEPTANTWLKDLPDLSTITQAIFISTNAVHYFFEQIPQHGLVWPQTIKTTAVGQATAHALEALTIHVDQVPEEADSEHLLELPSFQQVKEQLILLIKGQGGRGTISDTLLHRGATLIALDVYSRVFPQALSKQAHSLWQDDAVDIILFTSQQSIYNIFNLFGEEARPWLCNKPCIVLSHRLTHIAMDMGIQRIIESRYDRLMNTLADYHKRMNR